MSNIHTQFHVSIPNLRSQNERKHSIFLFPRPLNLLISSGPLPSFVSRIPLQTTGLDFSMCFKGPTVHRDHVCSVPSSVDAHRTINRNCLVLQFSYGDRRCGGHLYSQHCHASISRVSWTWTPCGTAESCGSLFGLNTGPYMLFYFVWDRVSLLCSSSCELDM